jgi:hypothetical protein
MKVNAGLLTSLAFKQNRARYIELPLTTCGLLIVAATVTLQSAKSLDPGLLYFANAVATILLFVGPAKVGFSKKV